MTDIGDGTYSASYSITGKIGRVSLSAILLSSPGLTGLYYPVIDFTGEPEYMQIDPKISFDYGTGTIDPLGVKDNASVIWTGFILGPHTGPVNFLCTADATCTFTIGSV